MLGINRSGEHVELLRIDADDGRLVYTAAPPGQAVTSFTADTPEGAAAVEFANVAHDFPKRITYAREAADRFTARISGDEGDREASWTFARTGDALHPTLAPGTITTDLDAMTLAVEIPGSYCGRLCCAVLPTPGGPVLQVAIIDSSLDCSGPATGTCALPATAPLPRIGASKLTAPTWRGAVPHLYRPPAVTAGASPW
jgi:hypothetical protein